jgi:thymidylate synthase (FAD)
LEHVSFTFGIEGISRALTHQLVRHRLASYSQQSQRYVKTEDFKYIVPYSIKNDKIALAKFEKIMQSLQEGYDELLKTVPKEDARYVLPNAVETKIIVTMNARELVYFFKLRGCKRAQWEIRNLAIEMLKLVKKVAPIMFKNSGPSCLKGPCTEGEMYCGKIDEVKEFFKKL